MLGNCTNWDRDLDRDGTYQPPEADPLDPKPAFVHRRFQNLWGARYIDDAVLRRLDNGSDGTEDGRWYYLTDAQFSVRAVLDGTAKLTDRIRYSAYGMARHGWRGDTDGDGATTLADRSIILGKQGLSIGDAGYSPDCDLDRSGTIDSTDASLWAADGFKAALPAGWLADMNVLTSPSGHASPMGDCGYLFNPATQLYTVRFRHYDPGLGRWLERDPAGYVDGMNLLEYLAGTPLMLMDPFGLESDGGKFDPIPRSIWYEYDEGPWVRQVERETGRVYERRAVYRRHMTSWGEFELVGIERRLRPDLDRSDVDMPECLCSEGQDALVHAYGDVFDAAQGELASEVRSIIASGGLMLLVRTKNP